MRTIKTRLWKGEKMGSNSLYGIFGARATLQQFLAVIILLCL